ncbi:MAG: hypothetical protein ACR2HR_12630 [Euzebya sp.]
MGQSDQDYYSIVLGRRSPASLQIPDDGAVTVELVDDESGPSD